MSKDIKQIVGQHLLSFPEFSPAPFELYVKDGHNLIMFDPSGEGRVISKQKFMAVLVRLFNEAK